MGNKRKLTSYLMTKHSLPNIKMFSFWLFSYWLLSCVGRSGRISDICFFTSYPDLGIFFQGPETVLPPKSIIFHIEFQKDFYYRKVLTDPEKLCLILVQFSADFCFSRDGSGQFQSETLGSRF